MTLRQTAYQTLKNIEKSGQYSNIAIDTALKKSNFEGADKALLSVIVLGVIERKITLDYYIKKLCKNFDKIDIDTKILLRMGIYQIHFLDKIPPYAAVNESVNLAPRRSAGFVNAILRNFLRRQNEITKIEQGEDIAEYLSVKFSFPPMVCQIFINIYGVERTEKIFEIYNSTPPTYIRINTLKTTPEEYKQSLTDEEIPFETIDGLPTALKLYGVNVTTLPNFNDGFCIVQDLASQICVEATNPKMGDLLIDTCACPGSKSFGCGIKMQNLGKIFSYDLHNSKLSLIMSGAEKLGLNIIEVAQKNAKEHDHTLCEVADIVLCDVPCSGFGVIGKKPEIRYKDLAQTEKLPDIQADIIENCSKYVKVGGTFIYSTCTVLPRENEDIVQRFLLNHPEFTPEDFGVGQIKSKGGMLSLAPDMYGTDGFFIAKMRKCNS